ncbi:MAG TPA: glycosyltransferase [Bacteroidales bacterium]|nr:glycosyltransferase [Bacteroidales bacterium]
MPKFSVIVPVYNRPDEITELLESLCFQSNKDFEVLILEDNSPNKCDKVVESFKDRLDVRYFFIPGTDRSYRRNYGMEQAKGEYFILYDSDCVIPSGYFDAVEAGLNAEPADCFGGPDNADDSFTDLQKAVNYSMTSFFTTGGIRGGAKQMEKYNPRSFNMGISRKAFEVTKGFRSMIGEDIDFSLRVRENGMETKLYRDAFVYHKRRVSLRRFYLQVNTFGKSRIVLTNAHPGSLKLVHTLPVFFVLGHVLLLIFAIFRSPLWLLLIVFYAMLLFIDSWIKNKRLKIALLSIASAYTQLCGYGMGFLNELFTRRASRKLKDQESIYQP